MSDLIKSRTGIIALVGIVAFIVFALPTPHWIGWPALAIAVASLAHLIIVGDRRYSELRSRLNIDEDTDESSRKQQLVDLLETDKRDRRRR
jgi:hypothetical protein